MTTPTGFNPDQFEQITCPASEPFAVDLPLAANYRTDNPSDDFSELREAWWDVISNSAAGSVAINNSKLRITIPVSASDESEEYKSRFALPGDFEIIQPVSIVSSTAPSSSASYPFRLLFRDSTGGYRFQIGKTIGASSENLVAYATGADSEQYASTITETEIRVKRVGSTITCWIWDNDQWEWNGNTAGYTFTYTTSDTLYLYLSSSADFDGGSVVDFGAFDFVSGTVIWPDTTPAGCGISDQASTLMPSVPFTDDFSGNDGDSPKPAWWNGIQDDPGELGGTGSFLIENNNLNGVITNDQSWKFISSKFKVFGDFNVKLQFSDVVLPAITTYAWGLSVGNGNDDSISNGSSSVFAHMSRYGGTVGPYRAASHNIAGTASGSTHDTSGILSMVRTGSSLVCRYWNGSSWVTVITDSSFGTDDLYVKFFMRVWNTDDSLDVTFPEFEVVSGTVNWKPVLDYINYYGIGKKDFSAIFDKLTPADPSDDFSGADGDSPKPAWWRLSGTATSGTAVINNNKVRVAVPVSSADENYYVNGRMKLTGDFDIQVDFSIISLTNPSSSQSYPAVLSISSADGYAFVAKAQSSTTSRYAIYSSSDGLYYTTTNTSGKLRLVRSGSTIKAYIWNNSRWEWNGSTSGYTLTFTTSLDVSFLFGNRADYDGGGVTDFDNFTVNSGTVTWPNTPKQLAIENVDTGEQCYIETVFWDAANKKAQLKFGHPGSAYSNFKLYYDETADDNTTRTAAQASDDFNGVDGDDPSFERWRALPTTTASRSIQNNTLECSHTVASKVEERSLFMVVGDFDIQVDFTLNVTPNTNVWAFGLYATPDDMSGDDFFGCDIRYNSSKYYYGSTKISGSVTSGTIASGATAGIIRLVRVGSDVTMYIWNGSSWSTAHTETGFSSADLYIIPRSVTTSTMNFSASFDNFTINSADSITGFVGDTGSIPAQAVYNSDYALSMAMSQDPSGTAPQLLDSTSNGRDGTTSGSMTSGDLVDAGLGKGIEFDGVDDIVGITSFDESEITVIAACEFSSFPASSGQKRILTKYAGTGTVSGSYLLDVYNDGTDLNLRFLVSNGSFTVASYKPSITTSERYFFAGTGGTSGIKLYIDGDVKDSQTGFSIPTLTQQITIGEDNPEGSSANYFDGIIDQVIILNKAASTDRIADEYNSLIDNLISWGETLSVYQSYLESLYGEGTPYANYLESLYTSYFGSSLISYYGNVPNLVASLRQYYGDAGLRKRFLEMKYDDAVQFFGMLESSYNITGELRAYLESVYSVYGTVNSAFLESVYRIAPTEQLARYLVSNYNIQIDGGVINTVEEVYLKGVKTPFVRYNIEASISRYAILIEITLARKEDWLSLNYLDDVTVIDGDTTFVGKVFEINKSATVQGETLSITTSSPAIVLDSPYADMVDDSLTIGLASDTCKDLALLGGITLHWDIPADGLLSADTLSLTGMTPLEAIKKIVGDIGGVLQSEPGGDLRAVPRRKENTDTLSKAPVDYYLTTGENFYSTNTSHIKNSGYNRYEISTTADDGSYDIEIERISDSESIVKVYQSPWDDTPVTLTTSEVSSITGVQRLSDVTNEYVCDFVEIKDGAGSTTKPVYVLLSYDYETSRDLGVPTITNDTNVTVNNGETTVKIKYYSRYRRWRVTHKGTLTAQFILETIE